MAMNVSEMMESLQNFDINDLDPNEIGIWPLPVKIILCVIVFIATLAGGYYLFLKDKQIELEKVQAQEVELKKEFEKKAGEAANLEAYKAQIAEMKKTFGGLLRQLPTDTEVPGLLEDITATGLGSGLDFRTIKLQKERRREFYVELPIAINARGGYHELATFVSGVASLPRIVTLHDFKITPSKGGILNMNITAKTYRYKGGE